MACDKYRCDVLKIHVITLSIDWPPEHCQGWKFTSKAAY